MQEMIHCDVELFLHFSDLCLWIIFSHVFVCKWLQGTGLILVQHWVSVAAGSCEAVCNLVCEWDRFVSEIRNSLYITEAKYTRLYLQ